mmetsp:Transcript_23325/g.64720  ORF Transcript_23325/g.64720 Transcript_23325/m.64720 type:complete len:211 (-) Transcript_23325:157-789(-)
MGPEFGGSNGSQSRSEISGFRLRLNLHCLLPRALGMPTPTPTPKGRNAHGTATTMMILRDARRRNNSGGSSAGVSWRCLPVQEVTQRSTEVSEFLLDGFVRSILDDPGRESLSTGNTVFLTLRVCLCLCTQPYSSPKMLCADCSPEDPFSIQFSRLIYPVQQPRTIGEEILLVLWAAHKPRECDLLSLPCWIAMWIGFHFVFGDPFLVPR